MPRAADLDIGDIDASQGKQAEMLTPAGNNPATWNVRGFVTSTCAPRTCPG
jgi:hypothetical protein